MINMGIITKYINEQGGNKNNVLKCNKIKLELTLKELTALAELTYLGDYVLNNCKTNHKLHKKIYLDIANEYKKQMIEKCPDIEEDLNNIEDYLIGQCMDYTTEHEIEVMAEFISQKFLLIYDNCILREKFKSLLRKANCNDAIFATN